MPYGTTPVEEWGAAALDNVTIVFFYTGYLISIVKHDSRLWGKIQNTCQEGWISVYPSDIRGETVTVETTSVCEEITDENFIDSIMQDLSDNILPASLEELVEVTNIDVTQAACYFEI